jgi:hypothetical protein
MAVAVEKCKGTNIWEEYTNLLHIEVAEYLLFQMHYFCKASSFVNA